MYLDYGYFVSDEIVTDNDIIFFNIQIFFCYCGSDKQIYFFCAKFINDFFLFILQKYFNKLNFVMLNILKFFNQEKK